MRLGIRALLSRFKKALPKSSLIMEGGGAPISASTGGRNRRDTKSPALRRAPFSPSSPACGGGLGGGALAFRRSTAAMSPRFDPRLGSGPRFLESPDPNGRTLSGTSAASTSRSDHAPDGLMPRAARARTVSVRAREPPSFHFRKYPRERSLRERDGGECNYIGDDVKGVVSKKETTRSRPGKLL